MKVAPLTLEGLLIVMSIIIATGLISGYLYSQGNKRLNVLITMGVILFELGLLADIETQRYNTMMTDKQKTLKASLEKLNSREIDMMRQIYKFNSSKPEEIAAGITDVARIDGMIKLVDKQLAGRR